MISTQWMKFCTLRTSLDSLNFRGNMRFLNFNDIVKFVPIFTQLCQNNLQTQTKPIGAVGKVFNDLVAMVKNLPRSYVGQWFNRFLYL